jgi:hypothetical protein
MTLTTLFGSAVLIQIFLAGEAAIIQPDPNARLELGGNDEPARDSGDARGGHTVC